MQATGINPSGLPRANEEETSTLLHVVLVAFRTFGNSWGELAFRPLFRGMYWKLCVGRDLGAFSTRLWLAMTSAFVFSSSLLYHTFFVKYYSLYFQRRHYLLIIYPLLNVQTFLITFMSFHPCISSIARGTNRCGPPAVHKFHARFRRPSDVGLKSLLSSSLNSILV